MNFSDIYAYILLTGVIFVLIGLTHTPKHQKQ